MIDGVLLFGIALGIFASALVLRLGPASEWLVWPIPALLSPFAAVFYRNAALPWGIGLAIAQIAIAQYGFVRVFRATVKSGLLARYSAESVA